MTEHATQPIEIELKLALTEEGVSRLTLHDKFRLPDGEKPVRRRLVATYFDTPDQALTKQGMALRVRRDGDRLIQTLKTKGTSGVAASRGEWEWEVRGDTPDVTLLHTTPAAEQWPEDIAARLQPAFVTDVERTVWNVHLRDGTTVEAALDEGKVAASNLEEPVRELELELRSGTPGPLFQLALELHALSPLAVAIESKGERGYRLMLGTTPSSKKAADISTSAELSAAEAFRTIIESALGHLLANRSAAVAADKEGIHQMRVAIRRLRAALVLFKPHLKTHVRARFDAELRRIGQVFGEARDWDVFCTEVLPAAAHTSDASAWAAVLGPQAALRRSAAHAAFAAECHAPAFTAMVLGLAGWVEDGAAVPKLVGDETLHRRVGAVVPTLLDVLADKVERRGRHIGHRSDAELHALRKALKKLRYGIEFLESLFPDGARKPYLHQCRALQDVLGSINDTVMAVQCAEALADGSHVERAPAIALLSQSVEQQRHVGRQALSNAWERFRETPRFWR